MNIQKTKKTEYVFLSLQNNIIETLVSPNWEIAVTINGNVQIIEMKILDDISLTAIEPLLVETISIGGIVTVSEKIRTAMIVPQLELQNPVN